MDVPHPHSIPPPPGIGGLSHPRGTLILIFGILGLVVFPLFGVAAWVMGSTARAEIKAQPPGSYVNEGNVTAGWVLGIIATVLLILGMLALFMFAMAFRNF